MKISIIVLTYNHEKYICECLNSIKYQLDNYNYDRKHSVQVLIADDASTDGTIEAVKGWMNNHIEFLKDFSLINNESNLGTCRNYLRALKVCTGDYIKAIGGDDMLPKMSVFEIFNHLRDFDIVQGVPFIYDENQEKDVLEYKKSMNKLYRVCDYEKNIDFYTLIHRYCFLNAPATYVSKKLLTDKRVNDFLLNYKYTDDYPQWLKMSEIQEIKYGFISDISIIYRRTNGSAYIIRNEELKHERQRIYEYTFKTCKEFLGRLIMAQTLISNKRGRVSPRPCFSILLYLHKTYCFIKRRNIRFNNESVIDILEYINGVKVKDK